MRHKILLVDDEPEIAEILSDFLKGDGHEIVTANSGPEAVEKIKSVSDLTLLITDGNLPGIKGSDVCLAFAKAYPNASLCIISGHLDAEQIYSTELKELKVQFFKKPFSITEIVSWVNAQRIPATSGESESAA